nr:MAG TPA: hypothetical protein [Caudoviricetes sp.]
MIILNLFFAKKTKIWYNKIRRTICDSPLGVGRFFMSKRKGNFENANKW